MKICVLGGGESGVGVALLAKQKGYAVFLSDGGSIKPDYKNQLIENEISFEEKKHTFSILKEATLIIKSPGIPDNIAIIQQLNKHGVPVISEIEFAATFVECPIIGITGSNGKTTVTSLIGHILKKASKKVSVGGNIGEGFSYLALTKPDYFVLELSSFQLDGIQKFTPHIAVITNITPDHLDRYDDDFEKYTDAKFRITKNQTEKDFLIYDADDEVICSWLQKNKTRAILMPFSITKKIKKGAFIEEEKIKINTNKPSTIMDIKSLSLEGKHNLKNSMAAGMVAKLIGVKDYQIKESLESFDGVPHRLETVLKIKNVTYINDSKATNINATFYALESMQNPTIWILGGTDKGNDYSDLMPLVHEKVKAIICLGIDNQKIKDTFKDVVSSLSETQSMEDAVKKAYQLAASNDTVLLSPACASFDLFKNYEDRGNQFKEVVRKL